ncbi:unnamed protein product, partial [Ectocarpus sp. 8 AP-2014]
GGSGAAERFLRDDEAFGEAASVLPGRVGRKKNLVPTRAGGRTRTPSAKYQEFKEVQQVKTTNKLKGGGGAGGGGSDNMDVVDYYEEYGSEGSLRPPAPQQQQHYSSRQPRTG